MSDGDGPRRNPLAPYYPSDLPPGVGGDGDTHWGTYVLLVLMLLFVLAMLVPVFGLL